jgi:hypothetical protein
MLDRIITSILVATAVTTVTGCPAPVYEDDDDEDEDEDEAPDGEGVGFPGAGDDDGDQSGDDDDDEASGDGAVLEVVNDSGYTVSELFVSPCTSDTWGSSQLQGATLYPGDVFTLTDIPPDCYDLLATDGDAYWEAYGVDLDDTFTWTLED